MIDTLFPSRNITTVQQARRRSQARWLLLYSALVAITALVSFTMSRVTLGPGVIAWAIYLMALVAAIYQPRYGVYLLVGFTLAEDNIMSPWSPFTKNFSSIETLLYLNDSLIFSPLELMLVVTLIAWLVRVTARRKFEAYGGTLFWPAVAFTFFLPLGLLYGLGRGGNLVIALWESRRIYYLLLMLILTSNLIETRRHVSITIWIATIALFLEGLNGIVTLASVYRFDLTGQERIGDHAGSIHANTIFVLAFAVWHYKGSWSRRIVLPLLLPVIIITYVSNQRRSAYMALVVAIILVIILIYWENRRLFWRAVPIMMVIGGLYLMAFWNSASPIGMPAQAIRSAVFPDESSADYQSNYYRLVENFNVMFTIRSYPLTGVGFGNKFLIIMPMADISFFDWWEYIIHNSALWIWLKAGIGGFLTMIYLLGMAIVTGARATLRMPQNDLRAISLMATTYIVMHFVYTYVDMAWDAQSIVYVGVMMGLVNSLERIVARPITTPVTRWPWQQPKPADPELLPL